VLAGRPGPPVQTIRPGIPPLSVGEHQWLSAIILVQTDRLRGVRTGIYLEAEEEFERDRR
jgi:hypothetical protein